VYLVDDTPRTIEEAYSLLMLAFGRKQHGMRWIQLCPMELGKLLNILMGVTYRIQKKYSRKSLGLMVLLRGTRKCLWPRVIPRKKVKISLILIHLLLD